MKKILSLFLCLLMLVSMLPISALAAEDAPLENQDTEATNPANPDGQEESGDGTSTEGAAEGGEEEEQIQDPAPAEEEPAAEEQGTD